MAGEAGGGAAAESEVVADTGPDKASPGAAAATVDGLDAPANPAAAATGSAMEAVLA